MGPKSRFRRFRLFCIAVVGISLLAIVEPHSLRFLVKNWLLYAAHQHGTDLSIGNVEGSAFEPLTFHDVAVTFQSGGVTSKINVPQMAAQFSWPALLLHRGHGFFDKLTLRDPVANVAFNPETAPAPSPHRRSAEVWLPTPANVEAWNLQVSLGAHNSSMEFNNVHFSVSESQQGEISIGRLALTQNWFYRTFTDLHGTTALQGTRLVIANLNLDRGIWLKTLATDLSDLAKGNLKLEYDFAAFDGSLRGDLINSPNERATNFEATGSFSHVSVAALGQFLQVADATGGIIDEGKFTFRGSPQNLDKATIATRFEASNFVWGQRKWNSLVLGATVLNGKIQVPEFTLKQAHNELSLKGELALPESPNEPWWQSEFSFDVAGRINNLTELSSLLGPRFSDTAGVVMIDGSVRGANKTFSGQLIVSGTKLAYLGVPIDLLNAAIKLDGNEFQLVNFELAHGYDYLRGKGSINIFGAKRYSGEIKASIDDLTNYAALLQKPISPAPLAGGLMVDWSGDGSLDAHSGAFTARFRKLHTIGPPLNQPIDADLAGTYAPEGLWLKTCTLANGDTQLTTQISADAKALHLENLKLTRKQTAWLEGNAVLPLNLWKWWLSPSLDALASDAPFTVQLTAKNMDLEDVGRLTGHDVPIKGILSGTMHTDGTLRELEMSGLLKLTKGRIPANPLLPALDAVDAEAELDGRVLRFLRFAAKNALGEFTATGSLDFTEFEKPVLDLSVHGKQITFDAGPQWSGKANVDVSIAGTRDSATMTGTAVPLSFRQAPMPDFPSLLTSPPLQTGTDERLTGTNVSPALVTQEAAKSSTNTLTIPAPAFACPTPLDRWTIDIDITTPEPVKLPDTAAKLMTDLRLSGTGKTLTAAGALTYQAIPLKTEFAKGTVENATYSLGPNMQRFAVQLEVKAGDTSIAGYFAGQPDTPVSSFVSQPEMSQEAIRTLLAQGFVPLPEDAGEFDPDVGPFKLPTIDASASDSSASMSPTVEATPAPR